MENRIIRSYSTTQEVEDEFLEKIKEKNAKQLKKDKAKKFTKSGEIRKFMKGYE
jgi:hypothetical protein